MKKLVALLAAVLCMGGGATAVILTSGGPSQSATGSVRPAGWGQTPPGLNLRALPPVRGVATATMYDAIDVGQIPARPYAAAGYTAGHWPTYLRLVATWPVSHNISIAISAQYHAACLDVEPQDATPSQAGQWVLSDIRAGFSRPCLYSDLSQMPAVQANLRAWLGSGWRARVLLWLAWYRGFPGLVSGYDAVQYYDRCLGRNLDCSTVSLDFLRAAHPPYVSPKPPPPPLPLCIHRRESAAACAAAKAKIASDRRAAASSLRALGATNAVLAKNRCVKPYRRGICVHKGHDAAVFAQRASFFTAAAAKLEQSN